MIVVRNSLTCSTYVFLKASLVIFMKRLYAPPIQGAFCGVKFHEIVSLAKQLWAASLVLELNQNSWTQLSSSNYVLIFICIFQRFMISYNFKMNSKNNLEPP